MRPRLVAAFALPVTLWLQTGPAAAQYCDNLEGHDVKVSGTIDRMVEAAGAWSPNKFLPDTYDIDRGSRPAGETVTCKWAAVTPS